MDRPRLRAEGKFLHLGPDKFYLKALPGEYAETASAAGANTLWARDLTPELLHELAARGLFAVADLGFDECLGRYFGGDGDACRAWEVSVTRRIRPLAQHPALLAYDLGGPAHHAVERWLGPDALDRLYARAARCVKAADPSRPLTRTFGRGGPRPAAYLDFFSVAIQERQLSRYRSQLTFLQALAGGKPLVAGACGTDVPGTGPLDWKFAIDQQLRMALTNAGCAGAVIRPWRGDELAAAARLQLRRELLDAVPAIKAAFAETPFPPFLRYPKFSIVICVYNGQDTIEECLDGVSRLDYPSFEVIVVNDGSTDGTLALAEAKAARYGFRVVSQVPNGGLSAARNLGMNQASGEFIAYLDADAFPEPHWLRYLAHTFLSYKYAAVGGPNLNPPSSGWLAGCVDQAPGNPQIVSHQSEAADHIPGCNLAVRAGFMKAMGGFDPHYRAGGDDVHFCWQVLKYGERLGASPGAMVWHHRRNTVRGFLRQQIGYGKGEAVLERDWPERFNALGHQVLGEEDRKAEGGSELAPFLRSRIYQAVPGVAAFCERWGSLYPSMPEWALGCGALLALTSLGFLSRPFFLFGPLFALAALLWFARAVEGAVRAELRSPSLSARLIVGWLFLLQPLARLYGRLQGGLTPWRNRCPERSSRFPAASLASLDNSDDLSLDQLQAALAECLSLRKLPAVRGGEATGWDWQIEGGLFGGARCLLGLEGSRLKARIFPYASGALWRFTLLPLAGAALAAAAGAWALAAFGCALAVGAGECFRRQSAGALASLEGVFAEKFWGVSLWDEFQPPSHFFEKGALPKDRAARRKAVPKAD